MEKDTFDVIIIGAGAAGLMAAWELSRTGKKTAIIEARDYVGGRIQTILDTRFDLPVELGAEFVHGDLELTAMLLKKAGAGTYKVSGSIWQTRAGTMHEQDDFIDNYKIVERKFQELTHDLPVSSFLDQHLAGDQFEETRFTLKNYVEGYYAADPGKASTFALREELLTSDDTQFRIEGGYQTLVKYLQDQCASTGVSFHLSHPVKEIHWNEGQTEVVSHSRSFLSTKLLITVSVGVLQSETISFSPGLPQLISAVKKLGFGPVVKTVLQFEEIFWQQKQFTYGKDLDDLSFIFSQATIPTWWTYHPKKAAMLTGWSGGPNANKVRDRSKEEVCNAALKSLAEIFSIDYRFLQQQLKSWHVSDWVNDPYSCGGYSYEVVNGVDIKKRLKQPVGNTLFFAGEGLHEGPEIGTVEAALQSGRETAHRIIASFKK